jgi:hypothetical protein
LALRRRVRLAQDRRRRHAARPARRRLLRERQPCRTHACRLGHERRQGPLRDERRERRRRRSGRCRSSMRRAAAGSGRSRSACGRARCS